MNETPPQPYPMLTEILDVQRVGDDRYTAVGAAGSAGRLFGGQLLAQCLRAATLTVAGPAVPHAVQAFFQKAGTPGTPLDIFVERSRDGKSFATRSVRATQRDALVFTLQVSFHAPEDGLQWHVDPPAVPGPQEVGEHRWGMKSITAGGFEARVVDGPDAQGRPRLHPVWLRLREPFPEDRVMQACALAFLSDFGMARSLAVRVDPDMPPGTVASLQHSLWLHRPARLAQWHLMTVDALSLHEGRGLTLGALHTEDGVRVATWAQEAVLRPVRR